MMLVANNTVVTEAAINATRSDDGDFHSEVDVFFKHCGTAADRIPRGIGMRRITNNYLTLAVISET